ncbi:FBD-associated F-box protein At1g66310 [Linum perenne]
MTSFYALPSSIAFSTTAAAALFLLESKPKPTMLCDLPEDILYHILSFLDTKMAVQTSVSSRGWRYTWRSVPVLNLDADSFSVRSNFLTYVDKVFALHSQLYKIVRKFLELNLKFFIRLESLVCVSIDPPKVVKYLVEGSAKPGATYKRSP